ncbi:hypothetical protein [[Mycoplasma] testudinis]|uniref:hypothetical protein n=1 Tax=[Mycoplasma] testudinis TaxID=33924 RepID=UPI0004890A3E|nr:hypothetical protein [[Mycoplasma] testudinis]
MDSITDFLKSYGISKEDYENNFGGLIGKFSIPNAIVRYNPDLENQPDKVFYLIANTIFGVINSIVKNRLVLYKQDNYENFKIVVGQTRADNLKMAVYEELKQRTLSNYFPELSNQSTLISNAVTLNTNQPTIDTTVQLVNSTALNLVIDSKWEDLPLKRENFYDNALKYFATSNFANVSFGKENANKYLKVQDDGILMPSEIVDPALVNYVTNDKFSQAQSEIAIKANKAQLEDYVSRSLLDQIISAKADKNVIADLLKEKSTVWDANTIYFKNQVVWKIIETNGDASKNQDKELLSYISKVDNNLNHEPVNKTDNEFWDYISTMPYTMDEIKAAIKPAFDSDVDVKLANKSDKNKTILFWKNEIRFFSTQTEFVSLVTENNLNLVQNTDYQIYDSGNYLITGNDGSKGGNNLINKNNLPTELFIGKMPYYYGMIAGGSTQPIKSIDINHGKKADLSNELIGNQITTSTCWLTYWAGNNVIPQQANLKNNATTDSSISPNGTLTLYRWWSSDDCNKVINSPRGFMTTSVYMYLNPSTQTEFKPKYQTVFAVKFLRNITPT